jgi:Tol biopolymer transport system component
VYCREKLASKIKRVSDDLQIWLLNVNDGVNILLEIEGTQVKVSPDGEKILYVSDKQGSPDIWMYDLNKGSVSQLVVDPNSIDTDPSWTKDGNSIVYSSNKTGNFDLWIMNIREDKKRPLTNSLADERYPDCNPVTNEVVYCSDESDVWKLKKIVLPDEQ